MNQRIEINLPGKLDKELELITIEEGISKNEVVEKAVENYLFIRKFRALRKKLVPKAKNQGINSDDDIFKKLT